MQNIKYPVCTEHYRKIYRNKGEFIRKKSSNFIDIYSNGVKLIKDKFTVEKINELLNYVKTHGTDTISMYK